MSESNLQIKHMWLWIWEAKGLDCQNQLSTTKFYVFLVIYYIYKKLRNSNVNL